MTLDLADPAWNPDEVTITNGGQVTLKTSDESQVLIEVTPPPPAVKFDYNIPDDFTPGDGPGTYVVTYHHKGGIATGHVNVTVGGEGKAQ